MIIILIVFAILLLYYSTCAIGISKGIKKVKYEKYNNLNDEFVSVIIPFRNESENIPDSLESIKKQNYPKDKFEVIYVNDKSDDDSLVKIENALKEENIQVVSVPENYLSDESKIRAIKFGIENSRGKIIITTDCDCVHHANWLTSMLNCFGKKIGLVTGPVIFIDENPPLKQMQKLEFAGLVLTGAGLIGINKPVICNSANLAFRKNLYDMLGGFKMEKGLSSSADEFLMIDIHNKTDYKIRFCWDNDAVTYTKAVNSLKGFFHQRQRWANKDWKLFGCKTFLQLILVYLFYVGLTLQLILGIFGSELFLYSLLISLILKSVAEFQIIKHGIGFLFDRNILWILPLAEVLHIPYILISGISGIFKKPNMNNRKQNW